MNGTAFNSVIGGDSAFESWNSAMIILLLILLLCNLFRVYEPILKRFGMSNFSFSETFKSDDINIGSQLIARARNEAEQTRRISLSASDASKSKVFLSPQNIMVLTRFLDET